jgi:hypothetical protein
MSRAAPAFARDPGPDQAPRPRRRPSLPLSPLALLAYTGLAFGLFGAAWTDPFSRVIGLGPDPPVFMWYMRWVPHALSHGANPFFTNYLDYPTGINLMWQTSVPLVSLVLWPVTVMLGPSVAYNLMMTASVALSAWTAFLAFRRHVARPWTALLGGLVFGFSPYMLAQSLGHPHVGFVALCPLMMIAFEEIVIHQRHSPWRMGALAGGLASAQLLISEELLLTQVVMAAMAVAILAGFRPSAVRLRLPYLGKALAVVTGMLFLVGAVPLWTQFFGSQVVHGSLLSPNVFVSDLLGFVVPTSLQALAPPSLTALSDRFGGSQYEAGAYLGIPLLVLLVVCARRHWRLPLVALMTVMTILAAALSLGVTIHLGGRPTVVPAGLLALLFIPLIRTKAGRLLPAVFALAWIGLAVLPIFNNVVPGRLEMYVFLFGGLLLAVFLDRWLLTPRRMMAAAVMAAMVTVPLLPRIPFTTSPLTVPAFFTSSVKAVPEGHVVLVVPYAHDLESRAMVWQLMSGMWFRMPEGYANRPGPSLDPPETALGEALIAIQEGRSMPPVSEVYRARALADLDRWKIAAVVVAPMDNQGAMLSFLAAVMDAPPVEEGGVYLWRLTPP